MRRSSRVSGAPEVRASARISSGATRDPEPPADAILERAFSDKGAMADKRREVEELRTEIGKLDLQLLGSLERRAKLSKKIGEARRQMTSPPALPDTVQMEALLAKASGDVPPTALREIFREIFATCFSLEQPVVISFSGLDGGFAHAAARGRFGVAAEYLCCESVQ